MFKMSVKRPKFFGPGSTTANLWVETVSNLVELAVNGTGGGITSLKLTPGGWSVYTPPFPIQVAITTSAITARSGSTAGQGTADFQLFNPPTFSADPSRTGQTIYNFSSAAGGVATGKYVLLVKWYDEWFIVAAEC